MFNNSCFIYRNCFSLRQFCSNMLKCRTQKRLHCQILIVGSLMRHLLFFPFPMNVKSYRIVHIYHSITRIVFLYFGQDVGIRLGVAISEVSGPPVIPHKGGNVPLSALLKDTTSELAGLFSTTSHKCQAPSREAVITIFRVFWYDSTRGMNL